jgi:hypothetical protein
MKLYLAGPMQGIPESNSPAFHRAAKLLRVMGHEVRNPAECDDHYYRTDIEALGADLAWICSMAEGIALLPGWNDSRGARAEHAAADALGLRIIHIDATAMDLVSELEECAA